VRCPIQSKGTTVMPRCLQCGDYVLDDITCDNCATLAPDPERFRANGDGEPDKPEAPDSNGHDGELSKHRRNEAS